MISIGFLIPSVGPSQLAHALIRSANAFLQENSHRVSLMFFVERPAPAILQPTFAVTNTAEMFDFKGPLVATDLRGATQILKCPGATRRVLYAHDLDWTRPNYKQAGYAELAKVYRDERLELVARSQAHADLIELSFGVAPRAIIENADVAEFSKFLGGF